MYTCTVICPVEGHWKGHYTDVLEVKTETFLVVLFCFFLSKRSAQVLWYPLCDSLFVLIMYFIHSCIQQSLPPMLLIVIHVFDLDLSPLPFQGSNNFQTWFIAFILVYNSQGPQCFLLLYWSLTLTFFLWHFQRSNNFQMQTSISISCIINNLHSQSFFLAVETVCQQQIFKFLVRNLYSEFICFVMQYQNLKDKKFEG